MTDFVAIHVPPFGENESHGEVDTQITRRYTIHEIVRYLREPDSLSRELQEEQSTTQWLEMHHMCVLISDTANRKGENVYSLLRVLKSYQKNKKRGALKETKSSDDVKVPKLSQAMYLEAHKCLYYHYTLAQSLSALAKREEKLERQLEARQLEQLKHAKKVLSQGWGNSVQEEERNKALGDEMKIWDEHRDGNQVNAVNLLYFHAHSQFHAVLDLLDLLGHGKFNPSTAILISRGDAKKLSVLEELRISRVDTLVLLARTATSWAAWQHEGVRFLRQEPHQPSKEDERSFLDIYELYMEACSLFGDAHQLITMAFATPLTVKKPVCDEKQAKRRRRRASFSSESSLSTRYHRCRAASISFSGENIKQSYDSFLIVQRSTLEAWSIAVDGLISIKFRFNLPDAGIGFDGPPNADAPITVPFIALFQRFLAGYLNHLLVQGDRDAVRPIVALSLNENDIVRKNVMTVFELLQQLAISSEVKAQVAQSMHFSAEIQKVQIEDRKKWIARQLNIITEDIGIDIDLSFFTPSMLASNTDHIFLFRQILYFRHGILLPYNMHQDTQISYDSEHRKGQSQIESLQYHLRRQARRRRYSTVSRTIAMKLEHANKNIADILFAPLVQNRDISQLFSDFVVIGHGSFGEVYCATVNDKLANRDSKTSSLYAPNELVAIKKISLSQPLRDLKKEICTLDGCDNKNIVGYRATYHYDHHLWVVMEYCDGGTLEQLRADNTLDERIIAQVCRGILKGLQYLHETLGKVHRDIKPENIFLHLNGDVKLGDLGFCMDTSQETRHKRNSIAGTARYLAPEMIKKNGYNSKIDIWSFGCLVYFMLMGFDMYNYTPSMEAMFSVATCKDMKDSVVFHELPSSTSLELRHFLQMCLEVDPVKRMSARELLKHPYLSTANDTSNTKERLRNLFAHVFLNHSLLHAGLL